MPLSISDLFANALRYSWQQRRALFDIALIPAIFMLVIDLVFQPLLLDRDYTVAMHTNPFGTFLGLLAFMVLSLLPWSAFAVAWTRYCLLGPPETGTLAAGWSWRELRYFTACLKLMLVYAVCVFVVVTILASVHGRLPTSKSLVLMGTAMLFAIGYLLARLSLSLPAVAVDQRLDLGSALRYSQGNGWRLFALLILLLALAYFSAAFLVVVVSRGLALLFTPPFTIGPRVVVTLIEEVIGIAFVAPFVAAMALAFRQLTGWRPDGQMRPLPQPQPGGSDA